MPGFTKSYLFPDINVWIALSCAGHVHHEIARDWYAELAPDTRFSFCRFTQLGFLRLLTAEAVMGAEVLTQRAAWALYDAWRADARVGFVEEPPGIESRFRALAAASAATPKAWGDTYLIAFAEAAQLTLVTFDRAFRQKTRALLLLETTAD